MALSVLDDKSKTPDEGVLAEVLGRSMGLWDAIQAYLAREYPGAQNEWTFTSPKYGWILRARHKKRTVLYMIPGKKCFTISFCLGEKAVAAAGQSTLPAEIIEALRNSRAYVEGRGLRVEVRRRENVETVKTLIGIKMTR